MKEGERIKLFENTDVNAYIGLVNDMGFHAKLIGNYLYIGKPIKYNRGTVDLVKLGNRIRRARKEKGIDRTALAKLMNVDTQTVYNWERGCQCPKEYEKLERILDL